MTTDFFIPDTTYLLDRPGRASERLPEFQCVAVAVHPGTDLRLAFGFRRSGSTSRWVADFLNDTDWANGWCIASHPTE
jgi:hypothetical protein